MRQVSGANLRRAVLLFSILGLAIAVGATVPRLGTITSLKLIVLAGTGLAVVVLGSASPFVIAATLLFIISVTIKVYGELTDQHVVLIALLGLLGLSRIFKRQSDGILAHYGAPLVVSTLLALTQVIRFFLDPNGPGRLEVANWAIGPLITLGVLSVIRRRQDLRRLSQWYLYGVLVSAILGLIMFATGNFKLYEPVFTGWNDRIASSYTYYSMFGYGLGCGLALWVGHRLAAQKDERSLLPWPGVVALVVMIVVLLSRGTWIGAIAAVAFSLVSGVRKRPASVFQAGVLGIVCVVAMALVGTVSSSPMTDSLFQTLSARFASVADVQYMGENYQRLQLWTLSLNLIKNNLFMGIGIGNFGDYVNRLGSGWITLNMYHSHNTYLQMVLNGGLVTLLLFCWLLFVGIRPGFKRVASPLSCGLSAALVHFAVQGMVDYAFWDTAASFTFWVFLGLSLASWRLDREMHRSDELAVMG